MNNPMVNHLPYDKKLHRRYRSLIGYLGIFLPIQLILFSNISFFETSIQTSISYYYYTNLREIMTSVLSGIGIFLILYHGQTNEKWWLNEKVLTKIAGIMALCLVLVPVNPRNPHDRIYNFIVSDSIWITRFHTLFAAILFLIFSNLAINVFTRGQNRASHIPKSIWDENNIYRFCGIGTFVCLVLVPISNWVSFLPHILFFETIILWLFGFAWLIKGRAFGDKGWIGRNIYGEDNS